MRAYAKNGYIKHVKNQKDIYYLCTRIQTFIWVRVFFET